MISCSFIYNYQQILFSPSQSEHQWRQTDCLSITLNYFQYNNSFLQPAIHNLGADGTGKTISEFPIFYFVVAQLWKIFGVHPCIYRMLNFLVFICGLFALVKIFENVLKESFYAIVLPLFLFTSPMLVYYATNFLMNSTALSFGCIGLYFFSQFFIHSKNKYLYWMVFFFSLAGLLKATSLLSYVAIFGIFILELVDVKFLKDRKIFQHPKKQILPLLFVFLIQLIWYSYAKNYNALHNSGIFLIGTLPIWDITTAKINEITNAIFDHLHWDYFRMETEWTFVVLFFLLFIFYKKTNRVLLTMTTIVAFGLVCFVLLFFYALQDHDYYTLDMLILIPFTLLTFFVLLKNSGTKIFNSILVKIIVFCFLIHNVDFARRRINDRYDTNNWQNFDYFHKLKSFEEITPYLRSLGITSNDRVISLSDESINITLYMMNQKGWTKYNLQSGDYSQINNLIKLGAKYLFIYDKKTCQENNISPFIKNKIGQFKNVDIYKL